MGCSSRAAASRLFVRPCHHVVSSAPSRLTRGCIWLQMRGIAPQESQDAPPAGAYSMRVHIECVGANGAACRRAMRIAKASDFKDGVRADWATIAQESVQEGKTRAACCVPPARSGGGASAGVGGNHGAVVRVGAPERLPR